MSKNVLLSQGSIWLSETPVTVNNLNGYLIETKRQTFHDKFLSHTLIFGKGKMCYVVQTIFPESNKQFENQSYQIIKSVVYKDVIPSSKNYSMHFAQYSFEFSESKNNVDYYQCGNNISISVEPFFTKGNTDPGVIFYNRMQRLPFSSIELTEKGVEEIEISSLAGLQAVVIAINKNGERIYVYQSLLTEGGKHYWILGIVQSEAEVARLVELVKIFKH